MSNKPTSVFTNLNADSDIQSLNLILKPGATEDNDKLNKCRNSSSEKNVKDINKRIKQKIVSKVKSWNGKEKCDTTEIDSDLSKSLQNLYISSSNVEEVQNSVVQKVPDSSETALKDEQGKQGDDFKSRSCPLTTHLKEENSPVCQKSSPILSGNKPSTSSALGNSCNIYDKDDRKNKKDNKRNKKHVLQQQNKDTNMPFEGNSCLRKGKEDKYLEDTDDKDIIEGEFPYKYKIFTKSNKSVVFTNEVFVVYFNGDEVVCESKEPLKKGIEQQLRNKEMRHGHLLRTQEKYNLCLF